MHLPSVLLALGAAGALAAPWWYGVLPSQTVDASASTLGNESMLDALISDLKTQTTTTNSFTTTTKSLTTTTTGLDSKSTVPTLPGSSLLNPEAAASSATEAVKNKPLAMMAILSILETRSPYGKPTSAKSATSPAPTLPGGPAPLPSAEKSTATNVHGPLDGPEFDVVDKDGGKDGVVGRIFCVLKKLVRLIDEE